MSARLYPIVNSKICVICHIEFTRKKNYFGKAWTEVKCCSPECAAKLNGKTKLKIYKDETKHPRWKGDAVGYYGVHDWITKHYGQPKFCEKCGLDDRNRQYHWANLSGLYFRYRIDWMRMCVPCHSKYDHSRKNKELENTPKYEG